ncbi:Fic family protein [Seleniivibrio woodruffii]|uniref:Fic family protein n=2 Tax=Seleniivibrio woodruffii TaxID=1078050 RepID=A0A4R1K712_9BACT|nr:Fic family protein [Seleniivibrio woodruffii]TVZ35733.1 Fic family protein [Seleniivibrio woodruffii]
MENKLEIMTYKSGKFVFSADYDRLVIDPLVAEVRTLADFMMDLRVFPVSYRLDEELIIRSIMSTAAIEGNPLTEEEVGEVLNGGEITNIYQREIFNLKSCYEFLVNWENKDFLITEDLCKLFHQYITKDIPHEYNLPGYYRKEKVKVGDKSHGGIYVPPRCFDDIKMLMSAFIEWFQKLPSDIHVFVKAFLLHYYFAKIHPFSDGNGRTARILEGFYLANNGYGFFLKELSNYYYRQVDEYYAAFSNSHKADDASQFILFCLNIMKTALYERKEQAIEFAKRFAMRDFLDFAYKKKMLKERQFNLLNVLLDIERESEFSKEQLFVTSYFKVIYGKLSDRTVANDLNYLVSQNLLIKDGDKYRINLNYLKPAI